MHIRALTPFILTGTMAVAGSANAGLTSTWVGPSVGNWNTAANWNNGIPGTVGVSHAIIPTSRTPNTVTLNTSPTIESLSIGLGAALIQSNSQDLTLTSLHNDGLWEVPSSGSITEIRLDAPAVAFAGSGEVALSGSMSRIVGVISIRELVNEIGHTISGWGAVGNGTNFRLTNLGEVNANSSGHALTIAASVGTSNTNQGLLAASDGGTLILTALPLANTGGTILADAGGVVVIDALTSINGGVLTTAGNGHIETDDSNQSIVDVQNLGLLRLLNSHDLNVYGTIVNDGTISLESIGSVTEFRIDSLNSLPTSLVGTGELVMGGSTLNRIVALNGSRELVNGPSHTIHGGGSLGNNTPLRLANEGTVAADLPGATLTIDLDSSATSTNTGVLKATAGGTLSILSSIIDNTDGMILAEDGSAVQIGAATSIRGGTLSSEGSGYVHTDNGNQSLVGVQNLGSLRLLNSNDINLYGTIENDGVISVESSGALTEIRIDSVDSLPVTLSGAGTLALNGSALSRVTAINGLRELVNGPLHTIRGGGSFGNNAAFQFRNEGVINADIPGSSLTIDPFDASANTNVGTMKATNGGELILHTVLLDNSQGTLRAEDASVLRISAQSSILGGTLATSGTGYIRGDNGNQSLVHVRNAGSLKLLNGDDLNLYGTVTNDGTISMESLGSLTELRVDTLDGTPLTLAGNGELVLGPSAFNRVSGINGIRRLVNGPDHTIRGGGNLGFNSNLDVTNLGTVRADNGNLAIDVTNEFINDGALRVTGTGSLDILAGTFVNNGLFQVDAGLSATRTGMLNQQDGESRIDGTLTIATGGVGVTGGLLSGDGTVVGTVSVLGGSCSPSNTADSPIGSLTVNGTYSQSADGGYLVDLGLSGNDLLTVNGTAHLGGALQVRLVENFVPMIGQEFTILNASSISGVWQCVEFPQAGSGYFHVTYTQNSVKLVVDSAPPQESDLNFDGIVGAQDLAILLGDWGEEPCDNAICCPSDLNGDGKVTAPDLAVLLGDWS
ncbi:MAG: hypothetical protein JNL80_05300 [Phycisphaerae bacterium]|jgi:hypothetical protein|nr:hypothetical protein [Phycisphaerae bacterium]